MLFFVYWHKFANSGLWEYHDRRTARAVAEELKKQESVYRVVIIEGTFCEVVKDVKPEAEKSRSRKRAKFSSSLLAHPAEERG